MNQRVVEIRDWSWSANDGAHRHYHVTGIPGGAGDVWRTMQSSLFSLADLFWGGVPINAAEIHLAEQDGNNRIDGCRVFVLTVGYGIKGHEWPGWSGRYETEEAKGIAALMAESGNWNAMPILADAIQDAGCEDALLLAVLRHEEAAKVDWRQWWLIRILVGDVPNNETVYRRAFADPRQGGEEAKRK